MNQLRAVVVRRPCGMWQKLAKNCSAIVRELCKTQAESVRKMDENQNESCAELRTRSVVILHSSESGIVGPTETTQQAKLTTKAVVGWATACVLWVHLGDPANYHCAEASAKQWG